MREILSHKSNPGLLTIFDIFTILQTYPNLLNINRMHHQRYLTEEEISNIRKNFNNAIDIGYEYSKLIHHNLKPGLVVEEIPF